jgi:hypothetical protein
MLDMCHSIRNYFNLLIMICILRGNLRFTDKQYGITIVVINIQSWRFYALKMVFIGMELQKPFIFLKGDVNLADADRLVRSATNRLNIVLIPPTSVYAMVNA